MAVDCKLSEGRAIIGVILQLPAMLDGLLHNDIYGVQGKASKKREERHLEGHTFVIKDSYI